jgi:hypothetical protein
MKLKIQFTEETCFSVPSRKALPTRMFKLAGYRLPFRSLALADRPRSWKRQLN